MNLHPRFANPTQFSAREREYQLAPFRFTRIPGVDGLVLVVNELGEFHYLPDNAFTRFHQHSLSSTEDVYRDLRSKHFLLDSHAQAFWPFAVSQYRTRKSFLVGGPALHMIVVTLRCDSSCLYCQVSRQDVNASRCDLSTKDALLTVDRIFESPGRTLKIEFQGGEPLIRFDTICLIIEEIERRNTDRSRNIDFVIASTLSTLSDSQLTYCRDHRVGFSTSLDGPEWLHNGNRPRPGRDSFQRTVEGIRRVRASMGDDSVSALVTLTRRSLECPEEIIDTYAELGFRSMFLRSISPYGFAKRAQERIGYSTNDFLNFYDRALDYLFDINLRGVYLEEIYTALLLQHMLTPFPTGYVDLTSPTGAMLGALVYNYDGYVYASDEGRMLAELGDHALRLGHVSQPRSELFRGPQAQAILAASVAEALPGCADCAFLPYCGADPVGNHAEQGSMVGYRPTSAFCRKQTALFQRLFRYLSQPSSPKTRILMSWLAKRPAESTDLASATVEGSA